MCTVCAAVATWPRLCECVNRSTEREINSKGDSTIYKNTPPDDSKGNGAMLYQQGCHNTEAGCVKGAAEWQ